MKERLPLPPLDLLQRYSVDETCGYLRICRARLYQKIKAGEIHILKDGARSYVTGSEIARRSRIAA